MAVPSLVLDIDGTLTRPDGPGIDPRVFAPLRSWDAPVVLATGKATPYPVGLCQFIGIEPHVIAETGGVVIGPATEQLLVDPDRLDGFLAAYRGAGYDLGWGSLDLVNRWRRTEVAIAPDRAPAPIRSIAADHDLAVIDSGYAYHVTAPTASKGHGLEAIAALLDRDPAAFVAVGDSENDVSLFAQAGRSFAVANAAQPARDAADEQLKDQHASGTLSVLERLSD